MAYTQCLLLGFCGGALLLGLPWPGGPALPGWLAAVSAAGLSATAVARLVRRGRGPGGGAWIGLLLGLGWSGLAHHVALGARLDPTPIGVALTARLVTEPQPLPGRPGALRFQAQVLAVAEPHPRLPGATLRLSWYDAPALTRGDLWRLRVVVRGPWSYANPGGFDFERWLLGQGIAGTGWVRGGELASAARPGLLERMRSAAAAAVRSAGLAHPGVLLALLLGRGDAIPQALWDTLRRTGTVHLMVISGLHVSLASALGFLAGRVLGRLCPLLPLWLDARRAGCLLGALAGGGYVALAGAGVPALRALLMGLSTLLLLADGRRSSAGHLLLALTTLLAVQPLAVHQQGFWLSFAAVAMLLIVLGGRLGERRWRLLPRAQLALSLGLLPLVILFTDTVPWTAVPANLVAVPALALCVVPATLLAGLMLPVWPAAAQALLSVADLVVGVVLVWLEALARAPQPLLGASAVSLLIAQVAALWALLGSSRRHWPALLLCWGLPLLPRSSGLESGEFRIAALDVGQGSAVLIDTRRHRLLYDTGPAFPGGFDTGSAVVVPTAAAIGPAALDVLIVSHDDLDHVGGAAAVLARLPTGRVLTGHAPDPGRAPWARRAESCHGRDWRWDGVRFRLLQVPRPPQAADNDRSCILLVDDGRQGALLAGDIGTQVEARLLRLLPDAPPLTLMFAPHHGSGTSSSTALVRVARPRLVLISAGRDNRFGHPHARVLARYRAVGARAAQTGLEGALIWRSRAPDKLIRWRRMRAPYWRATPAGG